jgi:hypothetical protein
VINFIHRCHTHEQLFHIDLCHLPNRHLLQISPFNISIQFHLISLSYFSFFFHTYSTTPIATPIPAPALPAVRDWMSQVIVRYASNIQLFYTYSHNNILLVCNHDLNCTYYYVRAYSCTYFHSPRVFMLFILSIPFSLFRVSARNSRHPEPMKKHSQPSKIPHTRYVRPTVLYCAVLHTISQKQI